MTHSREHSVPQRGTTSYSCRMNEINVWTDRPRKRRTELHPPRLMMSGWLIPCFDGGGVRFQERNVSIQRGSTGT